ncbi:DUF669 domain-containing protein [Verrucomicrobium sp. BvORR106]|uniref:DUF669 domain-containing protein n=1 Tax=Verrucomicrobium sp. BvORR106 TaxID=1403819 RepID=UPI00056F5C7D|nr:DUF669 domain-containing protein [Verrucomicrobium sp. BvORR106]
MASYTSGPKEDRPIRIQLVKSGEYDLKVLDSSESQSSNGNDMIELKFEVILEGDTPGPIIYDNLVFTENSAWKIDQFRRAIGENVVEGEEVEVDADVFLGKRFRAFLKQEKDRNDSSIKRNRVGSYLEPKPGDKTQAPATSGAEDDDLPF